MNRGAFGLARYTTVTGPQGFSGVQGISGPQGFDGFQGFTGIGAQGFQGSGVQGLDGSYAGVGVQGAQGPSFDKTIYEWAVQPASIAVPSSLVGIGITSTPTVNGTTTSLIDSTGTPPRQYSNHVSTASISAIAGWTNTALIVQRSQYGLFTQEIKTGSGATDLTNVRYWVSTANSAPTSADDPASVHLAGFRYAPATDGTVFWRTCTKDGTTMTATATTVAVTVDTYYKFQIVFESAAVKFYINNTLVNTHTTNLPTATTGMGTFVALTNITGVARTMRLGRQHFMSFSTL